MERAHHLPKMVSPEHGVTSDTILKHKEKTRKSLILMQEGEFGEFNNDIGLPNEIIYDEVRITPSFMEFKDSSEGEIFRECMTIRNLGKKSAFIRIREPNSLAFRIKTLKHGKKLSPGLALKRWISYSFKRPSLLHALIPIEINGRVIDYRIICSFSTEHIKVFPSSVDFGVIDIGCSSGTKILTISNTGGKSTRFTIDLRDNEMHVNVQPQRGIVRPKSSIQIHVSMIGIREGIFFSEFWIKSTPNIRVPMRVNIIIPKLIMYHINTTGEFTLINFPLTFLDTRKYDTLVLRNSSFKLSSFVILAEIDNKLIPMSELDLDEHPEYKVFQITPLEGRLDSFHSIVFIISFNPTTAVLSEKYKNNFKQDFMIFLRIIRVHGTEVEDILRSERRSQPKLDDPPLQKIQIQDDSTSYSLEYPPRLCSFQGDSQAVRLCLHAEAEVPRIRFNPDQLYLEMVEEAGSITEVLKVQNLSEKLPVTVCFVKCGFADCFPNEKILPPQKSVDLTIKVEGKENRRIESPFDLMFNIFVESLSPYPEMKKIQICSTTYIIKCLLSIKTHQTEPKQRSKFTITRPLPRELLTCPLSDEIKPLTMKSLSLLNEKKIRETVTPKKSTKMPLTPLQIYNVKVTPTMLNFGPVAVKVSNYRELTFENKNKFTVMVLLTNLSAANISFVSGHVVYLKPDALIRKLIELRCDQIGKFNSYVDYVINDNHTFELAVTADVVTKHLSLEPRELTLGSEFLPQECYRPLSLHVELKNRLTANTKFRWEVPNSSSYSLRPQSGLVRGRRSLFVLISHLTNSWESRNSEAIVVCEDGLQLTLKLNAILPTPKVGFIKEFIDVGEMAVNLMHEVPTVVHNANYNEVLFRVDNSALPPGCDAHPKRGIIPPRGIVVIYVTLKFTTSLEFATDLRVTIEECLKITCKIKGLVSFPNVKISPGSIDMPRVYTSTCAVSPLSVTNNGKTTAVLAFLLEDYPEFRISSSSICHLHRRSEDVELLPGESKQMYLIFEPLDVASYTFHLPISVNEMMNQEHMDLRKSKQITPLPEIFYKNTKGLTLNKSLLTLPDILVTATVTKQNLFFNKLYFKFNMNIAETDDFLEISNDNDNSTEFFLETSRLKNLPFFVEYYCGKQPINSADDFVECCLACNESVKFKITFNAVEYGVFTADACIFWKGDESGKVLNKVHLEGHFVQPSVKSETEEVFIGPVPVNVVATKGVILQLENFQKSSKIYGIVKKPSKYSGNYYLNPLTVQFPNGNRFDEKTESLEVQLTFTSNIPTSFMTTIQFHVKDYAILYEIAVFGITDNSILTIHEYLVFCLGNDENKKLEKDTFTAVSSKDGTSNYTLYQSNFKENSENLITDTSKMRSTSTHEDQSLRTPTKRMSGAVAAPSSVSTKSTDNAVKSPTSPLNKKITREAHMQRVVTSMEKWLYSVPLKFSFYPDFIDGITAIFSGLCTKTASTKNDKKNLHEVNKSFVDILMSVAGSLCHHLKIEELPKDTNERITQVLKTYENMLDLLITQGASLYHVKADFLLNFIDYNFIYPNHVSLEDFESRSRQSWLDVSMQTYKIFVLSKIDIDILKDSYPELSENDIEDIIQRSKAKPYSSSERILLAWLEHHYEKERQQSWLSDISNSSPNNPMEEKDTLEQRNIENFENHLADSLVFILITASYCPFLVNEFFKNIYICPGSLEEVFHNAICVTNAWRRIRLGFLITPEEIAEPNCVQMLMLTAHLFEVLPTYLPRVKVEFSCRLSDSVTRRIRIKNSSNSPGTFILQFFGNDLEQFSVMQSETIFRVNPHGTKSITIQYNARKLEGAKVHLVQCGSAIGSSFMNNQCFVLEGCISDIPFVNEYRLKGKLYTVIDRVIGIQIPYNFPGEYDIFMSNEQPKDPNNLKMRKWSELKTRKVPRRVFLNQDRIAVMGDVPKSNLSITLGFMTANTRKCWLIFQSKQGDFVVQITTACQPSLTDSLTLEWHRDKCTCRPSKSIDSCPLNLTLNLNSKNHQLWRTLQRALEKSLNAQEQEFWSKLLGTDVGMKLINHLVKSYEDCSTDEFQHIFNKKTNYNVSLAENSNLVMTPLAVTINDVRDENGQTPIQLHLLDSLPDAFSILLKLSSEDGREKRLYHISFQLSTDKK